MRSVLWTAFICVFVSFAWSRFACVVLCLRVRLRCFAFHRRVFRALRFPCFFKPRFVSYSVRVRSLLSGGVYLAGFRRSFSMCLLSALVSYLVCVGLFYLRPCIPYYLVFVSCLACSLATWLSFFAMCFARCCRASACVPHLLWPVLTPGSLFLPAVFVRSCGIRFVLVRFYFVVVASHIFCLNSFPSLILFYYVWCPILSCSPRVC